MPVTISGSGTITGIATGGLPDGSIASGDLADNAVTAGKLASSLDLTGKTVTLPAGTGGKILQVVQTVNSGVESTTVQDTFEDCPGMSVAITPASTSNKVLITVSVGKVGNTAGAYRVVNFRLLRDATEIGIGDQLGSSRMRGSFATSVENTAYSPGGLAFTFLDSPSTTSAVTYKLQWGAQAGETAYLNRAGTTTDNTDAPYMTTISTITAMEVAG